MGVEESRPVQLMGFERDRDGDYQWKQGGELDNWVAIAPLTATIGFRAAALPRHATKWKAWWIETAMEGAPEFDTLEAALLYAFLEAGNGTS